LDTTTLAIEIKTQQTVDPLATGYNMVAQLKVLGGRGEGYGDDVAVGDVIPPSRARVYLR
jgi:hypothetical protein